MAEAAMLDAIWSWADEDADGVLSRAEADRLREATEAAGSAFSDAEWQAACAALGADPASGCWTRAEFEASFGQVFGQLAQVFATLSSANPETFTDVPMASEPSARRVVVTGGNAGIGLALCRQLLVDDACHVYLCSRSLERGQAAVDTILQDAPDGCADRLELVQMDVASDESVTAAAAAVAESLAGAPLYGLVNNAGTGLAHRTGAEDVVATNLYGPKRVCEAFIPLLDTGVGRIVNVGSGAGPKYVEASDDAVKELLTTPGTTWGQLEELVAAELAKPKINSYGVSKACLSVYAMILAEEYPSLTVSTISPGFIDTAIVRGFGAKKPPEEGTVSIRHCLFEELSGNGYYYGSDAIRSPLHYMRNPGEPPYTGPP